MEALKSLIVLSTLLLCFASASKAHSERLLNRNKPWSLSKKTPTIPKKHLVLMSEDPCDGWFCNDLGKCDYFGEDCTCGPDVGDLNCYPNNTPVSSTLESEDVCYNKDCYLGNCDYLDAGCICDLSKLDGKCMTDNTPSLSIPEAPELPNRLNPQIYKGKNCEAYDCPDGSCHFTRVWGVFCRCQTQKEVKKCEKLRQWLQG